MTTATAIIIALAILGTRAKLEPIKNPAGIFYQKEGIAKISNDHWKIIAFKNLTLIKISFDQSLNAQNHIKQLIHSEHIDYTFKIPIMSQLTFLNAINNEIKQKLLEINVDTPNRFKRGIINGLGSVWKIITGNLDAEDGEYYNECINKLESDDKELQLLMKNQIQIVSGTIKNFNMTLKKLEFDEKTFNDNLKIIQTQLQENQDTKIMQQLQILTLVIIEQIMEINTILLDQLNNIINSISFARLKILHPSVIDPDVLLEHLNKIPSKLTHGNLPFSPTHEHLSKFLTLIKIKAFQTNERIIFILQIPIVENSEYDYYHVFSAPTRDQKTNLFHTLIPLFKYIAISRDSKQYITIKQEDCTELIEKEIRLCYDHFPKTTSPETPCEVTALMESKISENCDKIIANIDGYNVQKLSRNKWLIVVSSQLPVTTICPGSNSKTEIIKENSLLSLEPRCNSFIGTTRVYASLEENNDTILSQLYIPEFQYDCCENLPRKEEIPTLKPIKINHLNLDELKLTDDKLREFDKNINEMLNEPFTKRHWNTINYTLIVLVSFIIIWLFVKCCLKTKIGYFKGSSNNDDQHPKGCCPRIYNFCNVRSNVSRTPSPRPGLHIITESNPGPDEIVYQMPSPTARRIAKRL